MQKMFRELFQKLQIATFKNAKIFSYLDHCFQVSTFSSFAQQWDLRVQAKISSTIRWKKKEMLKEVAKENVELCNVEEQPPASVVTKGILAQKNSFLRRLKRSSLMSSKLSALKDVQIILEHLFKTNSWRAFYNICLLLSMHTTRTQFSTPKRLW